MISRIRRYFRRFRRKRETMEHQQLVSITRGLQNAAAETNSLVAQQYIRVLSEFFERLPDGSLKAKMVRVELDENYYSMVPLVSLAAPTGLALERMRVQLSIRLESAKEERTRLLSLLRAQNEEPAADGESRAQFTVSLSPRGADGGRRRPSDHVHVDLEFRTLQTPESIQRVIDTYTNMMQPLRRSPSDDPAPIEPPSAPDDGNANVTENVPADASAESLTDGDNTASEPTA